MTDTNYELMLPTKKKPVKHYVDNAKLYTAMLQYHRAKQEAKEKGVDKPRVPEYVGDCIIKIANRLSTRPNFIAYSFRDDMIGEGIINCIKYIDNYDPDRFNNPFAYFTQIIYYAFVRYIKEEKKHAYVKQKSLLNAVVAGQLNQYQDGDSDHMGMIDLDSDYMSSVVEDFEKKLQEKKKKTAKAKKVKESDDETGMF